MSVYAKIVKTGSANANKAALNSDNASENNPFLTEDDLTTTDLNLRIKSLIIGEGTEGNGVSLNISTGDEAKNADIWLSSKFNSRVFFTNDNTAVQWALQNNVTAGGNLDIFSIGTDRTAPGDGFFIILPTGTIKFGAVSAASFNLPVIAAPASPNDGDVWRENNTNTGLKIRINGVTKTITVS